MKITFVGAGSTIFIKNIIGDIFLNPEIPPALDIALYDIDTERLQESLLVVEALNAGINGGAADIQIYAGVGTRKEALRGSFFVINTIQVGGYKPATVYDFNIPKKYGIRQTIADTLGIGGIFRALRTIPVVNDILDDLAQVAPDAYFLNYTNPMAMVTAAAWKHWPDRSIGLCHSVQVCAGNLLRELGMEAEHLRWHIAGINHMAWLLDIRDGNTDLYPEIKRRAAEKNKLALADPLQQHNDMVRYEIMRLFGYYVTESSEHNAEYTPFWIKSNFSELIELYNIPLDEYLRRCETQIQDWKKQKHSLLSSRTMTHTPSVEYAADIVHALITNKPALIHGNLPNKGYITNLPSEAIVEVPLLINSNGLQPIACGSLPAQCAALNQTNINVQILTNIAAETKLRSYVYQAAMLDPLTASELPPHLIIQMCDELFNAHAPYLPTYK